MLTENAATTTSTGNDAFDCDSDEDDPDEASHSFPSSPSDNSSRHESIESNRSSSWILDSRLIREFFHFLLSEEILKTPIRRASRTSISGAINFAMPLFDENPYHGLRRVIDISGDGPNNNGAPVTGARDAALEKGITINGLPIMVKEPSYSTMDIENLDFYYEDCVIGGPGAFVVSIKDRDKFREAIRTKLLLEVAGRTPERPVVPVAEKEPRVSCLIGEKIWQDRWGR